MTQTLIRSISAIITIFVLSAPPLALAQKVPTLPDTDFEVAYLAPARSARLE